MSSQCKDYISKISHNVFNGVLKRHIEAITEALKEFILIVGSMDFSFSYIP